MKSLLKAFFAYRYRQYWLKWRGDSRGPFQPSPFFRESEAYLIASAIRTANIGTLGPEMEAKIKAPLSGGFVKMTDPPEGKP
jgi:hypothetical protein